MPKPPPSPPPAPSTPLAPYARAALLLALLGASSAALPRALSPVYGAIAASLWHGPFLMAGCFVGWAANIALQQALRGQTARLLPVVALAAPALQWRLLRYSSLLGPSAGPALVEALTILPLAVFTSAAVADALDGTRLPFLPAFVADAAPGLGSWGWLKLVERLAAARLDTAALYYSVQHQQQHFAARFAALAHSRVGAELVLGLLYAAAVPSRLLALGLPPLLHTLLLNTHLATPAATASLSSAMLYHNWLLLDRRESLTGYLSVLQSFEGGFRAMRCDHSLLGGDWIERRGSKLPEPIYGVFVMLEAVRLALVEEPVADKDARALVIGLGVGTTPSALVTHGINTTVVEIDPAVHELAARHFNLKENNPPVLQDAVSYTAALAKTAPATFDYIVHDVFTGGAEPAQLFTLEFLQGLSTLLKPNGVIGINYAGDLALPAPAIIYRTISHVFPTCRVYREVARDDAAVRESGIDFANMVIFCTKTTRPLNFRLPEPADHLQSPMRAEFLRLEHEVLPLELLAGAPATSDSSSKASATEGLLRRNDTRALVALHEQSALGHWHIMRKVMPAWVWEHW